MASGLRRHGEGENKPFQTGDSQRSSNELSTYPPAVDDWWTAPRCQIWMAQVPSTLPLRLFSSRPWRRH